MVEAVQAPKMIEEISRFAFGVMVQVVPPTQVAVSKIAVSVAPGTEAPGAPPLVVDHIAVDELSQMQVVVQTAKRLAANVMTVEASKNRIDSVRRFIYGIPHLTLSPLIS